MHLVFTHPILLVLLSAFIYLLRNVYMNGTFCFIDPINGRNLENHTNQLPYYYLKKNKMF